MRIASTGDVTVPAGELDVTRGGDALGGSGYPVIQGNRIVESTDATTQSEYDASTRSGITSTRHSTKLAGADYPAGYGVDVSFEVVDNTGALIETGAIGMNNVDSVGKTADFVFMVRKSCAP